MGRYAIFNGLVYGGGTAVIPNPEGTPTDELHSIQIGDDIYEIVGGGGSGEGYSETLLYKYENGTTVDGIKTLNDDITNYDLLLFRLVFNVPTYTDHIISVSALEQVGYIPSPVATGPHVSIVSYASDYIRIVEGETKNKINIFEINGNEYIDEIYGIKIEGGSSSGGGNASLDATTLYDTPITSTGTYTLADDYNNYDFIGFKAGNGSTETDIRLYAIKDIQDSMNDNLVITNNVTNSWFNFTINENKLTIPGKTVSTIYSVIGYKIKGGSSGASAIEKTQNEYNALPQDQKENGAIYMVQGEVGEEKDLTERMSDYTSSSGTVSAYNSKSANFLAWHALASEDSFDARVNGEYWAGIGDGAYLQFDFTKPVMILKIGFASYLASNFKIMYSTDGNEYIYAQNVTREAQSGYVCTKTDTTLDSPIRDCVSIRLVCDGAEYNVGALHFYGYDSVESVNKIYYMGTEYANTNGGSGCDGGQELISYDTTITTTQYGWWTAEDKDGNILDPDQYELIAVTPFVNNSPSWVGSWDGAFFINTVDGVTHRYDVTFVNINDGGYIRSSRTWDIKVVYRDKNAAGGGGGSTVVPNPQEEPTDTLNTIEIDGVVYDIEGGSEGGQGLNPANYSTEEEVIGVWTNNLPVYKKTWTFSSAITVGSNSWADTSISVNDTQIHTIVNCEAVGPNGQAWTCISATTDEATQTYVRILNTRNTDVNVKHLTLYYIKDGDSPIVPPGAKGEYNYYGGFIDTSNVIDSGSYQGSFTYTATEDCFINIAVVMSANDSATITIDGALVTSGWCASLNTINPILPLKKGQTLVATASASNTSSYTVYGISYGSGGSSSGSKVEYSTVEKEVGTWIDGSKIYQKSIVLSAPTIIESGQWVTVSEVSIAGANKNIKTELYLGDDDSQATVFGKFVNGTLNIYTTIYLKVNIITVQYTKTTS